MRGLSHRGVTREAPGGTAGWTLGALCFCPSRGLQHLSVTGRVGATGARLDTAVTPSAGLYKAPTMTVGSMAAWLHVGGMHACRST